jgi:hypothetical protein
MKVRKKPVEVEAWRWDGESIKHLRPEWLRGPDVLMQGQTLCIDTLEGTMTAQLGDWIIRGVKGEIYPCKPDIFEQTYEPVDKDENS